MIASSVSRATTVGVFAALAYDITSANLSSPQTFELNAGQRAPTLNKWLNLNVIEAAAWGIFGSMLDGSPLPLLGVALGTLSMWIKYKHAVAAGTSNGLPDMENHDTGSYDLSAAANPT